MIVNLKGKTVRVDSIESVSEIKSSGRHGDQWFVVVLKSGDEVWFSTQDKWTASAKSLRNSWAEPANDAEVSSAINWLRDQHRMVMQAFMNG